MSLFRVLSSVEAANPTPLPSQSDFPPTKALMSSTTSSKSTPLLPPLPPIRISLMQTRSPAAPPPPNTMPTTSSGTAGPPTPNPTPTRPGPLSHLVLLREALLLPTLWRPQTTGSAAPRP